MDITPEVQALQDRCKELGVKFHHMHGPEKLQELIDAHEQDQALAVPEEPVVPMPAERYNRERQAQRKREAGRLVRCRIQCLDPMKASWPGELISVGSAKLGTFKKYVPFNTGKPYHLPQIIFDFLKDRECSFWFTYENKLGHKLRRSKQGKAFALEVLPPLTKEELKDMSLKKARAEGAEY